MELLSEEEKKKRYNDLHVHEPTTWENDDGPKDWYAISGDHGIFAYAGTEEEAWRIADLFKEAK